MSDEDIAKHPNAAVAAGGNDTVHLNQKGAEKMTEFVAEEIKDLILDAAPSDNYEIKLFVWDDFLSMKPLSEKISPLNTTISIEEKANGVVLNWNSVDGASSYDIYRDNKKIATVTGNSYDDKYFSTVAELSSDTNGEYGKAHTYSVSAGNVNSNLVSARADTSLLKYFTVGSITVRPTTLAGVNAKSSGISLVPNPQVAHYRKWLC